MLEVTARSVGITPSKSLVENNRAFDAFELNADPGTTLILEAGTYDLQPWIKRSALGLRGLSREATTLLYSSHPDKPVEEANGVLIGKWGPATEADVLYDVTVSDLTIQDANTVYWPDQSERPAQPNGLNALIVDRFTARRLAVIDSKGNGNINVLGLCKNLLGTGWVSEACWLDDILVYGTEYGEGAQGDGINLGGFISASLRRCVGRGMIYRHFIEGGPCQSVLIDRCDANMGGVGLACVASFSAWSQLKIQYCDFRDWSAESACIPLQPDEVPPEYGGPLPVRNVSIFATAMATRNSGLAAVTVDSPRVSGLKVNHCYFNCPLPFHFAHEPLDGSDLSKNQAWWTRTGNKFISSAVAEHKHEIDVTDTTFYGDPSATLADPKVKLRGADTLQSL